MICIGRVSGTGPPAAVAFMMPAKCRYIVLANELRIRHQPRRDTGAETNGFAARNKYGFIELQKVDPCCVGWNECIAREERCISENTAIRQGRCEWSHCSLQCRLVGNRRHPEKCEACRLDQYHSTEVNLCKGRRYRSQRPQKQRPFRWTHCDTICDQTSHDAPLAKLLQNTETKRT